MKNKQRKWSVWLSRIKFGGFALLTVFIFTTFMYFAGTRLENPDLTPAPASSAEELRQSLAIDSRKIASAAQNLEQTELAKAANNWEKELGGIWVPWPKGAPSGYQNPPLDLSGQSHNIADLKIELTEFAKKVTNSSNLLGNKNKLILLSVEIWKYLIQLSPENDFTANLTPISIEQIATNIKDPKSVVALESIKQILEANTANISAHEKALRKINQENIALLDALINTALANGIKDERTTFIPPSTPLSTAKELMLNTLSDFATDTSSPDIAANNIHHKNSDENAKELSAEAKPTTNEMLVSLILRLAKSF